MAAAVAVAGFVHGGHPAAASAHQPTGAPDARLAEGELEREEAIERQEADERGDADLPISIEEGHELDGVLRAEHPDVYAGLWRDGDRLLVAVAGDDADVGATVHAVLAEPELVDTVAVTYSVGQLEATRGVLEAAFEELAASDGVHALFVDVPANRVVVEAVDADEVDLAAHLDKEQAAMVEVASAPAATTLADDPTAASTGAGGLGVASVLVLAGAVAVLVAVGVFALMLQRRQRRGDAWRVVNRRGGCPGHRGVGGSW